MPRILERPSTRRSERVETIHAMLERYHEARAESSGAGGGESHLEARINMWDPHTYTAAYKELDRCLDRLHYLAAHGRPILERDVSAAKAWWAVRARYLEAQVVRREVHLRRTHSGERVPANLPRNMETVARATILNGKTSYMMVRVWDPRVQPEVVGVALRWISNEYKGTPATYRESE